ncbi:hypothetical protein M407DRAFT_183091 [Tulasnella calospora MUT 4182]|uniref:Uncharacterized protein n=1 Tax=Tulasnella calospora MUT 4182 TaxID=1051891 RepID=A0A0C3Q1Z9_9AGAM|nr:hypothetical protein M407DRAFT_183091 [Tulasnella calospora MUT 4182]
MPEDLKPISPVERENLSHTISFYTNQTLCPITIAIAYRDLEQWPPKGSTLNESRIPRARVLRRLLWTARGLVFLSAYAQVTMFLQLSRKLTSAVSSLLAVSLWTDRLSETCPMLSTELVSPLRVLARSSPEGKKILVEKLSHLARSLGHR